MFTFSREKARFEAWVVMTYSAVVALCLVATLIYIYPSIRSTALMYEYSDRLRTLKKLKEFNKKMKLEISALRSYDFIEERAVNELGFQFPASGQVVIVAKK